MTASFTAHLAAFQSPSAPSSGQLFSARASAVDLSDANAFTQLEYTADASIELTGIAGPMGHNLEFDGSHGVLLEVIKTADTASGTVAIVSAHLGFSSETVNLGNAEYTAQKSGATVWVLARGSCRALAVEESPHIALNFNTPVGFKVRVTIVGNSV